MKRTVAAVVILLTCTGCAAEPAAAPPALDATTVSVGPSTTLAPSGSVSVAESDEPGTTTVPACDLGDALDAVWMVETSDGHGSGFHIGDGDWMSAAHVVGDLDTVLLRHGSDEIEAVVVGIDHTTDVALLNAPAPISASLMLSADVPEVGSDTIAAGFPLYGESEPSVTRGVLSRFERDTLLGELVLTDTAVNPGNSGGPLLDACGAVVGMIVQKIVDTSVEGVGYAVTAGELDSQLPRLRDGYRTPSVDSQQELADASPELPPWEITWTDPDLMTGESVAFMVVRASEYEGDNIVYPPELSVGCYADWVLLWGGAFVLGGYDSGVYVEYRVGDGEIQSALWEDAMDNQGMVSGQPEMLDTLDILATRNLHIALRSAPPDALLTIRAWDSDDNVIGTAVFPTGFYADFEAVFTEEFCFGVST